MGIFGDAGKTDNGVLSVVIFSKFHGTQNVVSTDAGTYYRLTIQDTAKQHIDRKGYRQAESSVWRQAWLWCMGIVLAAYCLVALPRMRRHGQEEA